MDRFAAIDFETADCRPDSACALAVVIVEDGRVTRRRRWLIRPPRRIFEFTDVHGITWDDVATERTFAEVWPEARREIAGAGFLAAHNASFDRDVLESCCRAAHLGPPRLAFVCTVSLARRAWHLFPTKLPNVCAHLGIALDHHEPLSDAEACARIVLAAGRAHVRAELARVANEVRHADAVR